MVVLVVQLNLVNHPLLLHHHLWINLEVKVYEGSKLLHCIVNMISYIYAAKSSSISSKTSLIGGVIATIIILLGLAIVLVAIIFLVIVR